MSHVIRHPKIVYIRHWNATTSVTPYPSGATDGVKAGDLVNTPADAQLGQRVHVAIDYTVTSGTMSATTALYGYTTSGTAMAASPRWLWIGSMNSGTSMAADTSKWSPDVSTIRSSESFSISGQQFDRFATRSVFSGTGVAVSTFVGFEVA